MTHDQQQGLRATLEQYEQPLMAETDDVFDVITPAAEGARKQRRIRDLPKDMSPGSREVALLTAVTKAQAESIVPMAEALQSLRDKGPDIWGGKFLVAEEGDFNWRTAPWKKYESFEDFYSKELAPVFGAYEEFLQTADRVARGEISTDEAAKELRDRTTERANAAPPPEKINSGHHPNPKGENGTDDIIISRDTGLGTSANYLTRRIVRDHPDIAEKMRNGEYRSVRQAALDAGIVHPTCTIRTDDAESIVATLRRQLPEDVLKRVVNILGGGGGR